MIKYIKSLFDKCFSSSWSGFTEKEKRRMLADVWGDSSVRTDLIKWHHVKDVNLSVHESIQSIYLVDDGKSEYPVIAHYTEYFRDHKGYFFCDYYGEMEGKPMDPQPIRFALLPKLNGK